MMYTVKKTCISIDSIFYQAAGEQRQTRDRHQQDQRGGGEHPGGVASAERTSSSLNGLMMAITSFIGLPPAGNVGLPDRRRLYRRSQKACHAGRDW
jgi:hypothetical protein